MIGFLILVLTLIPLANLAGPFAGDRALDGVAKGESVNDAIDHPKTIDDLISMDADPTKFRDIKDVVPNPPTQEGFDSLWYAIVLVVGLMIALVCWGLGYRFRRKPSFQHWALDQVDRLNCDTNRIPTKHAPHFLRHARFADGSWINASSETTEQVDKFDASRSVARLDHCSNRGLASANRFVPIRPCHWISNVAERRHVWADSIDFDRSIRCLDDPP